MIETIKISFTTSNDALEYIDKLQKQFSIIFRSAFNKCYNINDKNLIKYKKSLRDSVKNLNNISEIDAWWLMCSVDDAVGYFSSARERNANKVIFGGKSNFIKRIQNEISNEDWKKLRLRRIFSCGEKYQKGNRKFTFKIIEENKIIFKPKRGIKFELQLPKLRKNYRNKLSNLQILMEEKKIPVTISLDKNYIYISYEEKENMFIKTEGNYVGIDLNPNYISLVLFNKNREEINQWTWNLNNLTKKSSEYNNNKLKFETLEISKKISQICKHYKINFVFFENLNIKTGNAGIGKWFNRLCNNTWKRNIFINNLKKRLDYIGIKYFEINPAYSSFIGNMLNSYPDPISASCEIARRGYDLIIKKNKKFYPDFNISLLSSQWKDLLIDNNIKTWKEFFTFIKNSKLKYRISWSDDWVFRNFKTNKSKCLFCYKNLY